MNSARSQRFQRAWYQVHRRLTGGWRHLPREAAAWTARIRLLGRHRRIPALEESGRDGTALCMLLGAGQADMGIYAAWSLLRFLPGVRLTIFSDGSLAETHRKWFRRLVPDVRFVSDEERERAAELAFGSRYPLLAAWRRKHLFVAKFTDFHLCSAGDRIVVCDSDVLCFTKPVELIESLSAREPVMRWNEDLVSSYLAPREKLRECVGWEVPQKLNAGLLTCRRWRDDDWEFFEGLLERMPSMGLDAGHFWAEQSMYALAAGRHSSARAFGEGYSMARGPSDEGSVIRHYTSARSIRPGFFLEGVPRLLKQVAAIRP